MLELDYAAVKIIEAIYSRFLFAILLHHDIPSDVALKISREFFQIMRDY